MFAAYRWGCWEGNALRLRGPWLIRGAGLDTSVSSQSGSIPGNNVVNLMLSPYSFFPDFLQRRWLGMVELYVRFDFLFPSDADAPQLQLYNKAGADADYDSEWRHVNP